MSESEQIKDIIKQLIEEAFIEGWENGWDRTCPNGNIVWKQSETKKKLERLHFFPIIYFDESGDLTEKQLNKLSSPIQTGERWRILDDE